MLNGCTVVSSLNIYMFNYFLKKIFNPIILLSLHMKTSGKQTPRQLSALSNVTQLVQGRVDTKLTI